MDSEAVDRWERQSTASGSHHDDDYYNNGNGSWPREDPAGGDWERGDGTDRQQQYDDDPREERRQTHKEPKVVKKKKDKEPREKEGREREGREREREAKPKASSKSTKSSSSSNGPTVPEEFLCPLSLTVMTDPVIIASGQTYDRSSIERWFAEGNRKCPRTGIHIPHTNFCPNFALKSMISDWMAAGNEISQPSSQSRPAAAPTKKPILKSKTVSSAQPRARTPPPPGLVSRSESVADDTERRSDGTAKKRVVKKKGSLDVDGDHSRKTESSSSSKSRARSVSPLPSHLSKKVADLGSGENGQDGPVDMKAVWENISKEKPKKSGGLQRHLSHFPRGEGFDSPVHDNDMDESAEKVKKGKAKKSGDLQRHLSYFPTGEDLDAPSQDDAGEKVKKTKAKKAGGLQRHLSYFPQGEGFDSPGMEDDGLGSKLSALKLDKGGGDAADLTKGKSMKMTRKQRDLLMADLGVDKVRAPLRLDQDDVAAPPTLRSAGMRSHSEVPRKGKGPKAREGGRGGGGDDYAHGEYAAPPVQRMLTGDRGGGNMSPLPSRPPTVHGRGPSASSSSGGSSSGGRRGGYDERPSTSGAAFGGDYGEGGNGEREPWRGGGAGASPLPTGKPKVRRSALKNVSGEGGLERLTSSIPNWQAEIDAMSGGGGRGFKKSPTNPTSYLREVDTDSDHSAGQNFKKSPTNPTERVMEGGGYGGPVPAFPLRQHDQVGAGSGPRLQRNNSTRSNSSLFSMPGGSNDDAGGAAVRRDMGPMVEALNMGSGAERLAAVRDIRAAIKGCPENKAQLAHLGGIEPLVEILESDDLEAAEHSVAALMNLSLHWTASGEIVRAGGIPALVGMLDRGTAASQGNAAATLFALSKEDDHKLMVRASGAIPSLVNLLKTGTVRAKKDAALALFTLSTNVRCARDIIKAGAVQVLLNMCGCGDADEPPPPGLEEKATAVLSNIARIPEGCTAIVDAEGLAQFVDLLDEGSSGRVKEDSASVLLQLAAMGFVSHGDLLAEGVLPSLVRVSQTSSEQSEARMLLQILRQHAAENKR